MNRRDEQPDELEAELAAMTPIAPPHEVRRRIAASLDAAPHIADEPASPPVMAIGWRHRLAPLAAAACLALMLWLMPTDRTRPHAAPPQLTIHLDAITDADGPTVWAYRHALSDSPDSLDALLDRHGRTLLPPTEPVSFATIH